MGLPAGPNARDPFSGLRFGKYILHKRLAIGGMAEVYLGRLEASAGFSKPVVIKVVLPDYATDPQFIEMFLDEGRLAAGLSHPNIAQTFDLGEVEGRYYLAMEYIAGEPLHAVLQRAERDQKPMPLRCARASWKNE